MKKALVMSDRIAVMFDGRIAQLADSETLYRRPATKRVAVSRSRSRRRPGTGSAGGQYATTAT